MVWGVPSPGDQGHPDVPYWERSLDIEPAGDDMERHGGLLNGMSQHDKWQAPFEKMVADWLWCWCIHNVPCNQALEEWGANNPYLQREMSREIQLRGDGINLEDRSRAVGRLCKIYGG